MLKLGKNETCLVAVNFNHTLANTNFTKIIQVTQNKIVKGSFIMPNKLFNEVVVWTWDGEKISDLESYEQLNDIYTNTRDIKFDITQYEKTLRDCKLRVVSMTRTLFKSKLNFGNNELRNTNIIDLVQEDSNYINKWNDKTITLIISSSNTDTKKDYKIQETIHINLDKDILNQVHSQILSMTVPIFDQNKKTVNHLHRFDPQLFSKSISKFNNQGLDSQNYNNLNITLYDFYSELSNIYGINIDHLYVSKSPNINSPSFENIYSPQGSNSLVFTKSNNREIIMDNKIVEVTLIDLENTNQNHYGNYQGVSTYYLWLKPNQINYEMTFKTINEDIYYVNLNISNNSININDVFDKTKQATTSNKIKLLKAKVVQENISRNLLITSDIVTKPTTFISFTKLEMFYDENLTLPSLYNLESNTIYQYHKLSSNIYLITSPNLNSFGPVFTNLDLEHESCIKIVNYAIKDTSSQVDSYTNYFNNVHVEQVIQNSEQIMLLSEDNIKVYYDSKCTQEDISIKTLKDTQFEITQLDNSNTLVTLKIKDKTMQRFIKWSDFNKYIKEEILWK